MDKPDWQGPLTEAYTRALANLAALPDAPVRTGATVAELRAALGGPLPEHPTGATTVVEDLATAAAPGLMPTTSGRYFGFVIGGSTPAALAADWLTSAWDQNAGMYAAAPAAAVVEETAAGWLTELFGLPASASVGFVTGCQLAHVTCLAAARHEVLRRAGWDVETDGLVGAPPIRIYAGEERHATVDRALRLLGLGTGSVVPVPADGQGRMRAGALREVLAPGPAIVIAQAGNVNTGAFDPFTEIVESSHTAGAWVHVDGAFGLWAAASPEHRHLVDGLAAADSWATDAHKWLNVPYDSGLAIVADPAPMAAAMGLTASYLVAPTGDERDAVRHNPEASRRARGFPVYAALREHGRSGVAALIGRSCALARRFAERLAAAPGVEVLNDVVLNQVLVRFGDDDAVTRDVIARVQADGTCWAGGTVWRGRAAMRLSVSNWSTDEADIDVSADAILRCASAA